MIQPPRSKLSGYEMNVEYRADACVLSWHSDHPAPDVLPPA